jgi:uncharacterized membrane protein YedE/YeeE
MNFVAALFCGALFGFGLALSGMTDISKVIGFLDLSGNWDPTLAFVIGGGLLVSLPFFQFGVGRLTKPVWADVFRIPTRNDIDARLIIGAALFGIGWALVGLCPGPAIASLAYLNLDIAYFGIAMFAGMFIADAIERLLAAKQTQ